ncbi:MAG: hypothetical protein HC810_04765 [Acaryochloridaceae cyanobacterium RL_2_7]|nr:hypothetical protein [Acaryochloridaceae cyanobacterium RL_2_7]
MDLSWSNLSKSCLDQSSLVGTSFKGTKCNRTSFRHCELDGTDFELAEVEHAIFDERI